ncbi:Putative peptidoglycan binding domain-containing protein [Shimia gijangensis]|uniref:Putative peptidoglycan binding domain-containing protein n=1 Tax=Shimia gijangensis TaxID=1470563 RepID=A0A1M6NK43_9RHOB|nr:peptidoglycan-binding protein [Shimia gijangensis]SHJ96077.1 Putative peptidoglycan binding domain-containing protein [Shimia gijangensis]
MHYTGLILAAGLSLTAVNTANAAPVGTSFGGAGFDKVGLHPIPAQYVNPYEARRQEDALRLSRNDRRTIQGNLQSLGFNPGPADGLFGARTRDAIASWQRGSGNPVSGYLTRQQVFDLDDAALRAQPGGGQSSSNLVADLHFWTETGAADGNIEGMRRYLQRYPNGYHADVARNQIRAQNTQVSSDERRFWRQVRDVDTPHAYRLYLEEYPRGHYANNAYARLREIDPQTPNPNARPAHIVAWNEARQRDTIAGYEEYLRNFPNSQHARDARVRLKELRNDTVTSHEMRAWRRAQTDDTIAAYRDYIDRFPEGYFVRHAQKRIKELKRNKPRNDAQPADQVAWKEARRIDTISGYTLFLRDYPNSRRAPDARKRLEELRGDAIARKDMKAWRRAQEEDSISGYAAYLDGFPNGRFERDARRRLRELRNTSQSDARPADQRAWEAAHKTGTLEAYKRFLRDYPHSSYVPLAKNNVRRLSK